MPRALFPALLVVATAGCPSPPVAPPRPPPVAKPAPPPPLPPVTQKHAAGIPGRAFDDPRRGERVQSAIGEIDTMLRDAAKDYPALVAGVVLDEELVWSNAYGQRTDGGGAVDDDTVFRIGSITKTFTGMAALRLRDLGKLDLDAAAHDYLRPLGGLRYISGDDRPITVRQLLSHTSGLPRNAPVWLPKGEKLTRDQLFSGFDGAMLQSPPLDVQRYSNLGVGTAGLVVAAIANKPYRELVNETILAPLGMRSTYWEANDVPKDKLAVGHGRDGAALSNDDHLWLGPVEAAGAIYSSLTDIARFASLQLSAWPPRSGPDPHAGVLARASLRESHTMSRFNRMRVRIDDSGQPHASAIGTGVAWQVEQTCDIDHLVWHNGATAGYTAALYMAPRRGIAVILMSSSKRGVTALTNRIIHKLVADAALPQRKARPSDALQKTIDGPIAKAFSSGELSKATYESSFTKAFRAAVSYDRLATIHKSIFEESGSCAFSRYLDVSSPSDAWLRLECEKGEPHALWLRLKLTEPQRISGWRVRPMSNHDPAPPVSRCTLPAPDLDN